MTTSVLYWTSTWKELFWSLKEVFLNSISSQNNKRKFIKEAKLKNILGNCFILWSGDHNLSIIFVIYIDQMTKICFLVWPTLTEDKIWNFFVKYSRYDKKKRQFTQTSVLHIVRSYREKNNNNTIKFQATRCCIILVYCRFGTPTYWGHNIPQQLSRLFSQYPKHFLRNSSFQIPHFNCYHI